MALMSIPPIPQRTAQVTKQYDADTYEDSLQEEILQNAVEMLRRGSPDEKIVRNLADTWFLTTRSANAMLHRARQYVSESALRKAQALPKKGDRVLLNANFAGAPIAGQKVRVKNIETDSTGPKFWIQRPRGINAEIFLLPEDFQTGRAEVLEPETESAPPARVGGRSAMKHTAAEPKVETEAPEAPVAPQRTVQKTGPSIKPLKQRSPQVPEQVSLEAGDLPHKFEALASSMMDLNSQIQAIIEEQTSMRKKTEDAVASLAKEKGLADLSKKRGEDVVALFDGLMELGQQADVVAKRFGDVVLAAKTKSEEKPVETKETVQSELTELYRRLAEMDARMSKNILRQMDRWRAKNAQVIEKIEKTLFVYPQTRPQVTKQPETERTSQLMDWATGLAQWLGEALSSSYDWLMGIINDLTSMDAELQQIEADLGSLEETPAGIMAIRAGKDVLVSVASFNQYSFPAVQGGKVMRGKIVARESDGLRADFGDIGVRWVRMESVVGTE